MSWECVCIELRRDRECNEDTFFALHEWEMEGMLRDEEADKLRPIRIGRFIIILAIANMSTTEELWTWVRICDWYFTVYGNIKSIKLFCFCFLFVFSSPMNDMSPCQCNIVVCAICGDILHVVLYFLVFAIVVCTTYDFIQKIAIIKKIKMVDLDSFHNLKWHNIQHYLSKGLSLKK